MSQEDDSKLNEILNSQSKLMKYYSIAWFMIGLFIGIIGLVILAFIFGSQEG